MIRTQLGRRIVSAGLVGTAAFGLALGLATHSVQADNAQRFSAAAPVEATTFEAVLDAQEMVEVEAITQRIDKHLSLDAQGLVKLDPNVTAAQVGVTQEFLDNYRLALSFSNELIASGQIKVDANLKVSANGNFVGSVSAPGPGNPGKGKMGGVGLAGGEVTDGTIVDGDVPDWGAWRYNSGSMYYNSYNTWYTYGRTGQYYGLCNTMAAYIGYPWMSSSLNNLYTYNASYFNNYCYPNQGTYYFLPYSSQNTCQRQYNPCYNPCSYKPAYYWTRNYTYNYGCRCYQYQWQWTGTWSRY